MAVTKAHQIKSNLNAVINYILNPEKTGERSLCPLPAAALGNPERLFNKLRERDPFPLFYPARQAHARFFLHRPLQ